MINKDRYDTSSELVRKPLFPTALHQGAAEVVYTYFTQISQVDTVLVVNSCARGQAVPESDLDFAILVESGTSERQIADMESRWAKFAATQPTIEKYTSSSQFAHLHLDIITGSYIPTVLEMGAASDYFEVEIGNHICYAAAMADAGPYFQELQNKWLPYYDEALRQTRFAMTKNGCQYDLDHIPHYVARGLFFQAFDVLCRAFQEYLQVLFLANRTYPLAYNKWIKYQIEFLLKQPELYGQLSPIISVSNIEGAEINAKTDLLQELLDQVKMV